MLTISWQIDLISLGHFGQSLRGTSHRKLCCIGWGIGHMNETNLFFLKNRKTLFEEDP